MSEQHDYVTLSCGVGFILLAVVCFMWGKSNRHWLTRTWHRNSAKPSLYGSGDPARGDRGRDRLLVPSSQYVNSDIIVAFLVLLIGVGASLALFYYTVSRERHQAQLDFRLLAEESISSIENRITENATTVSAIASYFSASVNVNRHEFAVFVRPFLQKNKSIRALQWVPHVLQKDREMYETTARADGLPGFHFKEWSRSHASRVAGVRSDYFVVYYNEPLTSNMAVTGLDNGSEPVRRRALMESALRGSETYSPPITLMQASASQMGYLVYIPVYDHATVPGMHTERLARLRGFAAGVFLMDEVVSSALGDRSTQSVHMEISDVTDSNRGQFLVAVNTPDADMSDMSYDRVCSFGNRRWRFHVAPGYGYPAPPILPACIRLVLSLVLTCTVTSFLVYRSTATRMLRESEGRFRSFVENANDIVYAMSLDGIFTYVSPNWGLALGQDSGELVGQSFESYVHPDDVPRLRAFLHRVIASDESQLGIEHRVRAKNGNWRWHVSSGSLIRDKDGHAISLVGISRDITERKQAEEALQWRERRFRALIEHSAEAIALLDANGDFLYASPAVSSINGYPPDKFRAKNAFAVIHPDDQEHIHALFAQLLRSPGEPLHVQCRIIHKDGTWRWIEGIGRNLLSEPAVGALVLNYRDITKRKHAEEMLREQSNLMQMILDGIPDVIGLQRPDHTMIAYNKAGYEFLGMDASTVRGIPCFELMGKDQPCEECQTSNVLETKRVCTRERYLPDRGMWLEARSIPVVNESGEITLIVEQLCDITERKRNESRIRLHSAAINAADDLIAILGSDGRVVFANDAFRRQTGFEPEEIIGEDLAALCLESPEGFPEGIVCAIIVSGLAWKGEVPCRKKDGSFFTADVTMTPLTDIEGHTEHVIVIARNVTERKEYEGLLDYQAHHDALTDLPNRLLFSRELASVVADHGRQRKQCAVLFIDLDNFKMVNDTMGHQAGDLLLVEIAARLSSCMREGDVLARMGGDEFIVLLKGLRSTDDAATIAQRMLDHISIPIEVRGSKLVIGASIGVSTFPDNAADADGLLKAADAAMYRAKALGRNNCQFFSEELSRANLARVEMERDLRLAIENEELKVYYQPLVEIDTMRIMGAEALLRWDHPEKGTISPSMFVPVAEETGLILQMGRMVLETACRQCKTWQDRGWEGFEISVNVSPIQFSDIGFIPYVEAILADCGLRPQCLNLEITETALARNEYGEIDVLRRLKALGIKTSLDDFGIGYSSLSRLKDLPIMHMKVDGSFIRDIEHSANDRAMTESIVVMAHNLGITVTAEWIENEEQLATVKSLGCDYAQGYLVSPALPSDAFGDFVQEWVRASRLDDAA